MTTMARWGRRPVFWGRHLAAVPEGAVVFFPLRPSWLNCGLAGIVAVKGCSNATDETTVDQMEALLDICMAHGLDACRQKGLALADAFLGGESHLQSLKNAADSFKHKSTFYSLFSDDGQRRRLGSLAARMQTFLLEEQRLLAAQLGHLRRCRGGMCFGHLETLADIAWCLDRELLANMQKIETLMAAGHNGATPETVEVFYNINARPQQHRPPGSQGARFGRHVPDVHARTKRFSNLPGRPHRRMPTRTCTANMDAGVPGDPGQPQHQHRPGRRPCGARPS
jgi:hypothetical protein